MAEVKRQEPTLFGGNRGKRFEKPEHAEHPRETVRRILRYFDREKGRTALLLVVVLCGVICGVLAPSQQSRAVDIIAGSGEGKLLHAVVQMLVLYLIYAGSQLLQGRISARLSQNIIRRMREELFHKVVDLPVGYLDSHSHGDVMSRMTNDVENLSSTISRALPNFCSSALTIAGTAVAMLLFCWQLALLSFITVFLTLLVVRILTRVVRKASRRRQSLLGQLNGVVEETVSGYRTVVAYNHQARAADDFDKLSDEMTKAGIRTDAVSGIMPPMMNCISNISFVIIAVFGGYFAWKGMISVGVISAFIVYARQFSRPINHLGMLFGQLQTAIAGAERVFIVLDEAEEDRSGAPLEKEEDMAVSFRHVDFSYVPGYPVLRDFDLTVPAGKKVALVGATGSGKTTVANLLLRFYEPDSGAIFIGGQDIAGISRESLRRNVDIVLQDTTLFTDTVRNNLSYANENATEAQIRRAAALSRCQGMIRLLPHGYDTVLTGAGASISQGQRQLLAIARAFVADPEILILDEATSNVDTQTEKAIQNAMQRIMKDRTSIVIAHRLSTIRDADRIVVLDQGRIVESGRHEELLAKRGK